MKRGAGNMPKDKITPDEQILLMNIHAGALWFVVTLGYTRCCTDTPPDAAPTLPMPKGITPTGREILEAYREKDLGKFIGLIIKVMKPPGF